MEDVSGLVLVVEDGSESEDAGQMLPLVPDHEAVGDVVLEHFLDRILNGHRGNVLSASSHDDLLLSPGQVEEAVTVKATQVSAEDVALCIMELGCLPLLPEVSHAGVPASGGDLTQPSLVRVEDMNIPGGVRLSHTSQPGEKIVEGKRKAT